MFIDFRVLVTAAIFTIIAKGTTSFVTGERKQAHLGSFSLSYGLDSVGLPSTLGERPRLASEGLQPRKRTKRCTCFSYKDKECVYYCHLDIIWINTPERTVPYGMSSYRSSQRLRRGIEGDISAASEVNSQRCVCGDQSDLQCWNFCKIKSSRSQAGVKDRILRGHHLG